MSIGSLSLFVSCRWCLWVKYPFLSVTDDGLGFRNIPNLIERCFVVQEKREWGTTESGTRPNKVIIVGKELSVLKEWKKQLNWTLRVATPTPIIWAGVAASGRSPIVFGPLTWKVTIKSASGRHLEQEKNEVFGLNLISRVRNWTSAQNYQTETQLDDTTSSLLLVTCVLFSPLPLNFWPLPYPLLQPHIHLKTIPIYWRNHVWVLVYSLLFIFKISKQR